MRISSVFAIIVVCLALFSPVFSQETQTEAGSRVLRVADPVVGEYVVGLNGHPSQRRTRPEIAQIAGSLVMDTGGELRNIYSHAIQGFSVRLSEEAAENLSRNPSVAFVEEVSRGELLSGECTPSSIVDWHLDRINQRSLPLDGQTGQPGDGQGVNIYVLDTGVDTTHPEFGGRASLAYIIPELSGNCASDDCHGHGTQVAGVAAGENYGIASAANVLGVRVVRSFMVGNEWFAEAQSNWTLSGIDWVIGQKLASPNTPTAMNISIWHGASEALDSAVRNAIAAGIIVTTGSGNDYTKPPSTGSPQRVLDVITVAGTDPDDYVGFYNTSLGPEIDFFTPGKSITTAQTSDQGSDDYICTGGTSISAPMAAGVAAIYLSSNPGGSPAEVGRYMVHNATANKVQPYPSHPNLGGAPNLLLYSSLTSTPPAPPISELRRMRWDSPLKHFYTTDTAEVSSKQVAGWVLELTQCKVYEDHVAGFMPLHRYREPTDDNYFYTTDFTEGVNVGWINEGVAGYVFPYDSTDPDAISLYRFVNPVDPPLRHFYTTDYSEGSSSGFTFEFTQCKVFPATYVP